MAGCSRKREIIRRIVRTILRGTVCAGAAACAWPGAGPPYLNRLLPSLSPFNALLATAARAGGFFLTGAAVIAVICLFRPRAFCRWCCPAGICQNTISRYAKRRAWTARVPPIGPWLVLIGIGAALTGYPLFGWLDPLVLFNAAFGWARPHPGLRDGIAAAGLPLLLAAAFLAPGLWCGRLCPLGALQDILRRPFRSRSRSAGPDNSRTETPAFGRRIFLGLGLGAGYRLIVPPAAEGASPRVIRPPASGNASRFTRLCSRCGACVKVCPGGILRFGGTDAGWSGILAPEVCFDDDACSPSCTRCGQVCPSGAISPFSVKTKFAMPMGLATVAGDACLLGQNRECGSCVSACPYGALDLAWDPVNMVSRVMVKQTACTGCGTCEYVCPATPKAIRIFAPEQC